mmetsp:Transcript_1758/g.2372  ORF Transcript_1758/g.2372 Transcript_1758/m.2372 type:complete len:356 (+) Transcript_1758:84-1151(+)
MIDRTVEFHSAVKIFQKTIPESDQIDYSCKLRDIEQSKFAKASLAVSLGFKGTASLISQLEKLVKRTGCHNDPTDEISEVSEYFKKDLGELTTELTALERLAEATASKNSQRFRHYTFVVEVLKGIAADHTKKFQKALEQRTVVMKDQNERRKLYSHSKRPPMVNLNSPLFAPPPQNPPSSQGSTAQANVGTQDGKGMAKTSSFSKGPSLLKTTPPTSGTGTGVYSDVPLDPIETTSGLRRRPQTGSSAQNRMVAQVQMHELQNTSQQRMEEAHAVERMVSELGTLFTKMASMVAQQGEVITRIDDDVELAHAGIQSGHLELTKFYSIIKGNRSLIIKIFIILIIFIFLFIVVLK